MARLSIVIPAFGPMELVEATLASVLANRPEDCEVVMAHQGPYDDPYELAGEVHFVEVPEEFELIAALNAAVGACDSDFVHLLAPGVEVSEGWTEPALRHFHHALVAAVSPLVLAEPSGSAVLAGVAYGWGGSRQICCARSTIDCVEGPAWTASFYRLNAWEDAGGFDVEMGPSAADLDLALTLRRMGYRCQVEPECQVYAPAAVVAPAHAGYATGREQQRLFQRHSSLAGSLASSLLHPLTVASEFIGQLPSWTAITQLAGRIVGAFESGVSGRYEQKVAGLPRPEPIETVRPRTLSLARARQEAARRQATPATRRRAA